MKKWFFWGVMCAVSLFHGASFFGGSARAMQQGLDGVDNQAALLFIPLLWIMAVFVLAVLNVCTLISGMKIKRGQVIPFFGVFQLSGLSKKAKAGRVLFILAACLLMWLGYSLFAAKGFSIAYALSGGALLLSLYAWTGAALQGCHAQPGWGGNPVRPETRHMRGG